MRTQTPQPGGSNQFWGYPTAVSNESEFIRLFVATERRILGYLITLLPTIEDAEELMQETSIVIWEKFDEFLATQGDEPDLDRFTAWGCKIAFYKTLNARRKRKPTAKSFSEDVLQLISSTWLNSQESGELDDRRSALARCMEKLPGERREMLQDYYWRKMPIEQIASKQSHTVANVYKLMQRIRRSLHECIQKAIAG